MKTMKTEVPEGMDEVTLVIRKNDKSGKPTLRELLPSIWCHVELQVFADYRYQFDRSVAGSDHVDKVMTWRLAADDGSDMLHMLRSGKVVDGEKLLGLVPHMDVRPASPTLTNGSVCLDGHSFIVLSVKE